MDEQTKKRKKAEPLLPAIGKATLSGAVSGGILGGVERLLSGARKADILRGAAIGAGGYGLLAGGSQALGSELLGGPERGDAHAMTTRGLVGGLTAGGAAGAGIGALMAAGHLKAPVPRLLEDYYKRLAKGGRWQDVVHGGALGSTVGGLAGGFVGRNEGMESDAWRTEDEQRGRRRYMEP